MSLHDSPLADVLTQRAAMRVLAAATTVLPSYGKDLTNRAGRLISSTAWNVITQQSCKFCHSDVSLHPMRAALCADADKLYCKQLHIDIKAQ